MSQTVFPLLNYRDPAAAIDFLERAFGFERLQVHTGDGGEIVHAELAFRGSVVMLGGVRPDLGLVAGQGGAYLVVANADEAHARACDAGAEVTEPMDTDYGSRDFTATDPEGNRFFFGTYAPSA